MAAFVRLLPLLAVLLAPCSLASAQGAKSKFTLDAGFEPLTAKPGDEVVLVLRAMVADGWHAYGTKETVNVPVALKPDKQQFAGLEVVGPAEIPPGEPHALPVGTSFPLPNEFVVRQRLRVPSAQPPGEVAVSGALAYQICDATMCLPPATAKYSAKLTIAGAAAPSSAAAAKVSARRPDPKFVVAVRFEPAAARPGQTVALVLDVTVDERYHAYGAFEKTNVPVSLDRGKLQAGGLEIVGDAEVPTGERTEKFGLETWPLPHAFQVRQSLRIPSGAAAGEVEVKGVLDYQLCDENSCDLPAEKAFAGTLAIVAGDGTVAPAAGTERAGAGAPDVVSSPDPQPTQEPGRVREPKYTLDDVGDDNALTGSWWSLILLSIAGGLFALVMPCTYPMIPITFSFFTKQADRRNGNVLSLALIYGIGIVAMFVLIGVAVRSAIIGFAGHWATNLVIGVAFVAFALSLFGFFTLQLPAFVTNAAGKASGTGGLLGVFLMGATLVVTSFTCTAPIVGALLAGVAEGGHLRVAVGMGVFGLTMAAPFVFLALLPGRVKALPKSGQWMNTLKVALGFVELAAALKFFSNVDLALGWQLLPRETFLIAWAFVFVVLALFLFGMMGYRGVPIEGVSKARNGCGLLSLAFAFYCLFGTMGFPLDPIMTAFEPPYRLRPVDEHTIVKDDHDGAMALAARDGKLVLVNFTGFT